MPIGLPSEVRAVLLSFRSISRFLQNNRTTQCRPDILPVWKPHSWSLVCAKSFRENRCSFLKITNLQKTSSFRTVQKNWVFLNFRYLGNKTLVFTETFSAYWRSWGLHISKIPGQHCAIRSFCEYLDIDRKLSKTALTSEGRPMGTYPFGLFLVLPGPT